MTVRSGSVRPHDGLDAAVLIAGALAEAGVTGLILRVPGAPDAHLHARVTDLPAALRAALAGAGRAELLDPARGTTVRLAPGRIDWSGADDDLHASLAAIGVPT